MILEWIIINDVTNKLEEWVDENVLLKFLTTDRMLTIDIKRTRLIFQQQKWTVRAISLNQRIHFFFSERREVEVNESFHA